MFGKKLYNAAQVWRLPQAGAPSPFAGYSQIQCSAMGDRRRRLKPGPTSAPFGLISVICFHLTGNIVARGS